MDEFFSSLLNKLNDVLFEVLGLLLPSLVLCIILAEPLFYSRTILYQNNLFNTIIEQVEHINQFWLTLFIVAVFYTVGNVIKVISKVYYDLGKAIFDNTIFKFIDFIFNHIKSFIKNLKKQKGKDNSSKGKVMNRPFLVIINVIYIWIKKIFSFNTVNYSENFNKTYIYLAKEKLKVFSDEKDKGKYWYSFYKEATTILKQYNIKTLYYKHLSKYNSFRSLECVFFCGIVYNMFFYNEHIKHLIYFVILGVNIVCTIAFHEKFKRYWMMCGNEVIAGLNYFYKNQKGNEEDVQ